MVPVRERSAPRGPVPLPGAPDGVVLYDGVCVLCSRMLRFVAARDPTARFRFAPIQGERGRQLAARIGIDADAPDTVAVILGGKAYLRSDAGLQILRRLPGWRWAGVLLAVPRPLRDAAYGLVAGNRYRLFGRTERCGIPDPALRRHLLPEAGPHG